MHKYSDDESLLSAIIDFLDDHDASELMRIVADALEEAGK